MSKLKFFSDEHIAKAIVEQLKQRDIEILRCEEVDMKNTDDELLLEYATEHGYALLSMDADVTRLNKQWLNSGKQHSGIFYAAMAKYQGSDGIGVIVTYCAKLAEAVEQDAMLLETRIHNQLLYVK